jgi:hypothetical protein
VHEPSICQGFLSQVTAIARERGAHAVESIVVEVGPLSVGDAERLSVTEGDDKLSHAWTPLHPARHRRAAA